MNLFLFLTSSCRSILVLYSPDTLKHKVMYSYAICQISCHTIYLLTLLPSSKDNSNESRYEELIVNGERAYNHVNSPNPGILQNSYSTSIIVYYVR